MEQAIVSGATHDAGQAKVTVHGVPDRPGVAAALFAPLGTQGVPVDMIVQNVSSEGITDISFTVPLDQADIARKAASAVADELGARGVDVDENIARVSVVGAGLEFDSRIAARIFGILAEHDVNIEMISTSAIRISCVVKADQAEDAVRVLHDEFQPPLIASRS